MAIVSWQDCLSPNMERTGHLFGLHSNDLGMLPTLLLRHFMKLQIQKKVVRKVVRKTAKQPSKKFTF